MSDSNSTMAVIFTVLTQLIPKGFHCKCYQGQADYKLKNGKEHTKKLPMDFFDLVLWVANMYSNISFIRLCAVQPFNNYLAAQ